MISLLAIAIRRKKLADYGISFNNVKYHLDIASTCFIPVVLASISPDENLSYSPDGGVSSAGQSAGCL